MNDDGRISLGALADLLTILFVILKLTKVINWSWLWVLSPLWICVLFLLILWIIIKVIL